MDDFLREYGIAIIGMSGRFPGANSVHEFWENLKTGKESISYFTEKELLAQGVKREIFSQSNYVPAKGILDDIQSFDADFFKIPPKDATLIDPQQRIFLECAWETLETAGYPPSLEREQEVGVFASVSKNTYLLFNLLFSDATLDQDMAIQLLAGNEKDYLSTRVSYKLNLTGPSVSIQSACSSSLAAVHMACQSLLLGECEMALAGGVSVDVPHKAGYEYIPGYVLSPDGRCRVFDQQARGTVFGQGVGAVLLKPLEKAIQDQDHIYAVIRGGAMNNDGARKTSFMAPSVDGQVRLIKKALDLADLTSKDISYVEAHGTGTTLGDPIEFEALREVFSNDNSTEKHCGLGSLKSNVGHLNAAAGITSLIKTALILNHKEIPPSININHLNEKIDLDNSPFFINEKLKKLDVDNARAGVSSFGIGGTNVHVILERWENDRKEKPSTGPYLLNLSARTTLALQQLSERIAKYIEKYPAVDLNRIAYTLQTARSQFNYRTVIIGNDRTEIIQKLRNNQEFTFLNHKNNEDEKALLHLGLPSKVHLTDDRSKQLLFLEKLATLWSNGIEVDWKAFLYDDDKFLKVPLPVHPFKKQKYWIDAAKKILKESTKINLGSKKEFECFLIENIQQLLNVERINIEDNFFALGGNSLLGVRLITIIQKRYDITLDLDIFYSYPKLSDLTEFILLNFSDTSKHSFSIKKEITDDLVLDPLIHPPTDFSHTKNTGSILITGATGFLGAYVIKYLLQYSSVKIYCLVRAQSMEEGRDRLFKNYTKYHEKISAAERERIIVVLGDVAVKNLGIKETLFQQLASSITSIYHIAGRINFIESYQTLKKVNVEGTINVLRFSGLGKTKLIHYVSSIAAFHSENFTRGDILTEDQSLVESTGFSSGYDQTKWASEILLQQARERGFPITVFRPGNISGDVHTGCFPVNDVFGRFFKGCLDLGVVPESNDFVDIEPINYVAEALVYISLQKRAINGTFHLVNYSFIRWNTLMDRVIKALDHKLEIIPYEDWVQQLFQKAKRDSSNPLIPFLPLFQRRKFLSGKRYDCQQTLSFLQDTDIICPEISEELIGVYIRYLL